MATLNVLLITNDPALAGTIRASLAAADSGSFRLKWVRRLSEGLGHLRKRESAVVLVELSLPDSEGIETFYQLFNVAPEVPILIAGGNLQEALVKEAVAYGAHDYILPAHLDSYSLPRALRNAIERRSVEDALYVEKERALVTFNVTDDAVLCTNISGEITYLNLVAETMTGWRRDEAIGKPLSQVFKIVDGSTRKTARDPLDMAIEQNRAVGLTVSCDLIRRDGFEFTIEDSASPIHDWTGRIIGAVIVFHDVSAAQAMSAKMTYAAQQDLVTNLPNRLLLNDRISQAIALARRQSRIIAVMFLDLDHFKHINDSLRHAAGDKLLQSVSRRLLTTCAGRTQ